MTRGPTLSAIRLPLRGIVGRGVISVLTVFVSGLVFLMGGRDGRPWAIPAAVAIFAAGILYAIFYGDPLAIIGGDGVKVRVGLRPLFVPYTDLKRVDKAIIFEMRDRRTGQLLEADPGIRLTLRTGRVVDLPVVGVEKSVVDDAVARMREAIGQPTTTEPPPIAPM
jgi:hypothetical protein